MFDYSCYTSVCYGIYGSRMIGIYASRRAADGTTESVRLSPAEALRLQWELKRRGAKREYTLNMYDPTISQVMVY